MRFPLAAVLTMLPLLANEGAAAKGAKLLQKAMAEWKQDCNSCHSQWLPLMALEEARRHGVTVDTQAAEAEARKAFARMWPSMGEVVQHPFVIDPSLSEGYGLATAATLGVEGNLASRITARRLGAWQRPEGYWRTIDGRPPQSHSVMSATAVAVRAVAVYAPEKQDAVASARKWLLAQKAVGAEEQAMRLLGLLWSGAGKEELSKAALTAMETANGDGAWGQMPGMASDAYATGLMAYALREAAGMKAPKALEFLRNTQLADGSWKVATRIHTPAPVSPPYFETGFPHGRDQFISMAAAAWAVMALAADLPMGAGVNKIQLNPPAGYEPWMETNVDPTKKMADGTTALMLAAGDYAQVKKLLDAGADATARAKSGYDALMAAALYPGNSATLELLLAKGADAKARKGVKFNMSAFYFTAMGGDEKMAEILIRHGAPIHQPGLLLGLGPYLPFLAAASFENVELMRLMVKNGVKVDVMGADKMTALSWSALAHKRESVKTLLELGANPKHVDKFGLTPMQHTAALANMPGTAAELLGTKR